MYYGHGSFNSAKDIQLWEGVKANGPLYSRVICKQWKVSTWFYKYPNYILTSGCWLNSWPTKEDPLRVVARMRMCVRLLELDEGRVAEGEERLLERLLSHPRSEASAFSWSICVEPRRLQLTAWPTGQRFNGLVENVRMAVYWMAMEANASSTIDFQEHCMVVRTDASVRGPQYCLQDKGSNTRRHNGQEDTRRFFS